ncbi:aspartic peptidase domain-containing protein [Podospora australis]|uniref:Aspartic peptidase domain-containing protein n=1 Tax=Podospora australis TaxID=1536484 RepID=A0AAN7AE56_9PEZI|nr:aspartic peptidase domain-containing protein [Podospora australis]
MVESTKRYQAVLNGHGEPGDTAPQGSCRTPMTTEKSLRCRGGVWEHTYRAKSMSSMHTTVTSSVLPAPSGFELASFCFLSATQIHRIPMRQQINLVRWLLIGGTATVVLAAEPILVAWTTDKSVGSGNVVGGSEYTYGPDGPWQAIAVDVGGESEFSAMWPTGGGRSMILTSPAGGNYTLTKSTTATNLSLDNTFAYDDWGSFEAMNESTHGAGYMDRVGIRKVSVDNSGPITFNTTVYVMDKWQFRLPDGSNHSTGVGILGLGPMLNPVDKPDGTPPGILEQFKINGDIDSMSFSIHMGSVPFQQRGSLVLGGYEQNRALGPVGVFKYDRAPLLSLLDVRLGTAMGASPLAIEGEESVWQGLGGNKEGEDITKLSGYKEGSAVVFLNPATPYIYLPLGTCEAVARQLPVTWNSKNGLYVWNTQDPQFSRIVQSPTYLSFVFSDRTATNLTIKVPMQLLNLTLEPPLAPVPTPYFPCKPLDSAEGVWVLGRAFLQAAFFAVNLEQNVTFLAQAPGPDMDQRLVNKILPGDVSIKTNPIEGFEQSWQSKWTALEGESNGTSGESIGGQGLSNGALAGIVVGVILGVAALSSAAFWCWRRRRHAKEKSNGGDAAEVEDQSNLAEKVVYSGNGDLREMDSKTAPSEVGHPLSHEMEVTEPLQEVSSQPQYYELSAQEAWRRSQISNARASSESR